MEIPFAPNFNNPDIHLIVMGSWILSMAIMIWFAYREESEESLKFLVGYMAFCGITMLSDSIGFENYIRQIFYRFKDSIKRKLG